MFRIIFSIPRPQFLLLFVFSIGAIFAIFITVTPEGQTTVKSAGITLGLTDKARESLQQTGQAFPASEAAFSAYYRVPDGAGGFGLDKSLVDEALFSDPGPTLYRAGIGTLLGSGANYSIGAIPIIKIIATHSARPSRDWK